MVLSMGLSLQEKEESQKANVPLKALVRMPQPEVSENNHKVQGDPAPEKEGGFNN